MAKITTLFLIFGILHGGSLAANEIALPDDRDLESDIELCCLMAALHDAKTAFNQEVRHNASSTYGMLQAISERIYRCARVVGLRIGRTMAEAEISKETTEIPFARLLETPMPELSDVVPACMSVVNPESNGFEHGLLRPEYEWILNRAIQGFEHGYRLGILDAVDLAILTRTKHLPKAMVPSDVHRLRLLWIRQWSSSENRQTLDFGFTHP